MEGGISKVLRGQGVGRRTKKRLFGDQIMNHSKTHFGGDGRKVGFRYRSARRALVPNGTSNEIE